MAARLWLLLGGVMTVVAVAVVIVLLRSGDGDDRAAPDPVDGDAPASDSVDGDVPEPTPTVAVQESTTTAPDVDEPLAPTEAGTPFEGPIAVAVQREGRLEMFVPGETPTTLIDELDGRTVQAVAPSGEVLLSPVDQWFESVQVVGADGVVSGIELATRGAVLNQELTDDGVFVELMLQADEDEPGDILRLDLATGVLETVAENVIEFTENVLPIARAGEVVVHEYGWIDAYELTVTDAAGTSLPSPTDGRYGVGYGLRYECPGAVDPLVDSSRSPLLDEGGRRLAWLNRVVGAADEVVGPGEVVRADVRVLRLSDGTDGSVAVDPALGALVALRGEWAVLEGGFVNIVTGAAIEMADGEVIVAASTTPRSDAAPVPPSPLPEPACPDGGLSIYGLRDLRVGQPAAADALAGARAREPECWLFTTDTGQIAVQLDGEGVVLGVVVADVLEATPSGIRLGTTADDVVDLLGERVEASPPSVEPAAAEALSFVPADPAEANLGLRFMLRGGQVIEMWAGDRAFTRSGESCVL